MYINKKNCLHACMNVPMTLFLSPCFYIITVDNSSPVEQCLFKEIGPSSGQVLAVRAKLPIEKEESLQVIIDTGVELWGERRREREGK